MAWGRRSGGPLRTISSNGWWFIQSRKYAPPVKPKRIEPDRPLSYYTRTLEQRIMSNLTPTQGNAVIDASNISEAVSAASDAAMQAFDRATNSNDILAAAEVAEYIEALRQVLEPKMGVLMSLADSPLGFKTDRHPSILAANKRKGKGPTTPYPPEVVKDCILEAHLRGVKLVANQFNIISGQCYIPKDGYRMLINKSDAKGFDYKIRKISEGRGEHVAEGEASWKLDGKSYTLKQQFFCKAYDGFTTWEQSEGKATRKLFKAVYERISGRAFQDEDEGIREGAIDVGGEVTGESESPAEKFEPLQKPEEGKPQELATTLLKLMGEAEIDPDEFVAHMREQKAIKKAAADVHGMASLNPSFCRQLIHSWGSSSKKYKDAKAKAEEEATA